MESEDAAERQGRHSSSAVKGRPVGPIRAWLRSHPASFAAASGVFMLVYGLWLFGDLRAGAAGALLTATLIYAAWRPGGFGWRLEEWNLDQVEEHGGSAVRWGWLLRASAAVIFALLVLFTTVVLVGEAIG